MVDQVFMGSNEATPAYTEEQLAEANASNQGGDPNLPSSDSRPEGLPENFNSVEDLAKSYRELQSKFSRGDTQETVKADTEAEPELNQQQQDNLSKVDMYALSEEYADNGQLTDKSYQELEALGFDKDTVDDYIEFRTAQHNAPILEAAGGEEAYGDMVRWAAANLTPAEQDAYDAAITSDPNVALLALEGLKAKFTAANGSDTNYYEGEESNSTGGYESWAQVTEAMKDPKYKTDPAFRSEVERKLAVTNL